MSKILNSQTRKAYEHVHAASTKIRSSWGFSEPRALELAAEAVAELKAAEAILKSLKKA